MPSSGRWPPISENPPLEAWLAEVHFVLTEIRLFRRRFAPLGETPPGREPLLRPAGPE